MTKNRAYKIVCAKSYTLPGGLIALRDSEMSNAEIKAVVTTYDTETHYYMGERYLIVKNWKSNF